MILILIKYMLKYLGNKNLLTVFDVSTFIYFQYYSTSRLHYKYQVT